MFALPHGATSVYGIVASRIKNRMQKKNRKKNQKGGEGGRGKGDKQNLPHIATRHSMYGVLV